MSQIELITGLPNWKWKDHSQKEIDLTGEELVELSDAVWRVGAVAVAGFIYHSYTSPPWMWFVLADKVTIADLIDFRRIALQIPKGTLTAVEANYTVGLKFAKVYSFEDTGEEILNNGLMYKIMRKV